MRANLKVFRFVPFADDFDHRFRDCFNRFVFFRRFLAENGNVWPLQRSVRETDVDIGDVYARTCRLLGSGRLLALDGRPNPVYGFLVPIERVRFPNGQSRDNLETDAEFIGTEEFGVHFRYTLSAFGCGGELWQTGNHYVSPSDCLDCHFVASEEGHADKWGNFDGIDGDPPWRPVPNNRCFIYVEETFTSVREHRASASAPRKDKRVNEGRRKSEEAIKSCVDNRFNFLRLTLRSMDSEVDDRFTVRINMTSNHARTRE